MRKHSAWIIAVVLDLLFPARGRHGSADAPPTPGHPDTPPSRSPVSPSNSGCCGERTWLSSVRTS
ncbi:hypothetical protein SNOUR_02205 [Streptomyces noursei ATCC 11455]|nr:hypothetical protein SNOUR_02205 [Streptomyces noursei ATCC 11455]